MFLPNLHTIDPSFPGLNMFNSDVLFNAETSWEFPRRFDGAAAVLLFSIKPPYYQHSHGTCREAQPDI